MQQREAACSRSVPSDLVRAIRLRVHYITPDGSLAINLCWIFQLLLAQLVLCFKDNQGIRLKPDRDPAAMVRLNRGSRTR
jgi:hypothetical protein